MTVTLCLDHEVHLIFVNLKYLYGLIVIVTQAAVLEVDSNFALTVVVYVLLWKVCLCLSLPQFLKYWIMTVNNVTHDCVN
jgi:hypothetical protein